MDAHNPYQLRPWLGQYGSHIGAELPTPAHPNLAAMARAACTRYARQTAFTTVMPNGMYGSLSYSQVQEKSDHFAHYLRRTLGLVAGDRVAIQMPNCLSYPVVLLGVLKAGCVAVNTNPMYTASEMAHQFKDSGAKVVVIVDTTPLMMTRTVDAARKDCLTYLLGTRTVPAARVATHPSVPLGLAPLRG
jgi:long-chain acyl-CoA synthetase